VKILVFDAHIGTCMELRYVISRIFGARAHLETWLISGHAHLIGETPERLEVINSDTFVNLTSEKCSQFFEVYKDRLKSFDLIFVGYSTALVEAVSQAGCPIVVYNAVRYDTPYNWSNDYKSLSKLNSVLKDLAEMNRILVISNNLADHDYFMAAPHGVQSTLIPTIGVYRGLRYSPELTGGIFYNSSIALKSALATRNFPNIEFLGDSKSVSYPTLGKYKFIVHLPYDVTTMSVFEHYAAGIPLLFPTPRFFMDISERYPSDFRSQYWFHRGRTSYPSYLKHSHQRGSATWWCSRADFYTTMASINYFDSFDDLYGMTMDIPICDLKSQRVDQQIAEEFISLEKWRINLKSVSDV
jgi:hypothetical protein